LNAINNFVHTAQGRPGWGLCFNALMSIIMPLSFFLSVNKENIYSILIPWCSSYVLISISWIYITIRKLGITAFDYLKAIIVPIQATIVMALFVGIMDTNIYPINSINDYLLFKLILKTVLGAVVYFTYVFIFSRGLVVSLIKIFFKKRN
jgi:hypothetical protein